MGDSRSGRWGIHSRLFLCFPAAPLPPSPSVLMRRWLFVPAVLFVALFALRARVFDAVDRAVNRTTAPPVVVAASVQSLHDSLWIADFHNDALLWSRDLRERSARGHVDIPRLREGGFELAVFSVVTQHYLASNYRRTPAIADVMTPAAVAAGWPRATWFDPYARAMRLAGELRVTAQASSGGLQLVTTRDDMDALLRAQDSGGDVIGAVLLLEGMQAIDGRLARVDSLFAAGYRIFGVAHMFDNEVGGSAHGWRKGGLSDLGRRAVARLDSLGCIIDLAHASQATIDDVLAIASRPVLVSHTGITSACPGTRNLPDGTVARIASKGGLVAIGFWNAAACGREAGAIARSIRRAIEVAGVEHVALGSDFDGAVGVPFDAAHIATLTSALLEEGLSREEIRAVMGENEKRFLLEMLPPRR